MNKIETGNTTTLYLSLKKKWFDMIISGVKREEYRAISPYWCRRLLIRDAQGILPIVFKPEVVKPFDIIEARNGYGLLVPSITWVNRGISIGKPNAMWCEPEDIGKTVFILDVGEIIKQKN